MYTSTGFFSIDDVLLELERLVSRYRLSVKFDSGGFLLMKENGDLLPRVPGSSTPHLIPYILPTSVQHAAQRIEVPSEYAEAIAIYASYLVAPHGDKWSSIPIELRPPLHMFPESDGVIVIGLPPATLQLTYRDIADNKHSRTFEVTPTFSQIQQIPIELDRLQQIGQGQLRVFPAGVVTRLYRRRIREKIADILRVSRARGRAPESSGEP